MDNVEERKATRELPLFCLKKKKKYTKENISYQDSLSKMIQQLSTRVKMIKELHKLIQVVPIIQQLLHNPLPRSQF